MCPGKMIPARQFQSFTILRFNGNPYIYEKSEPMKKLLYVFIWLPVFLQAQKGEGGMWLPNEIYQQEADMKQMGMELSAKDIWNTEQPSLKDAVVQLGNGCTGEFVSEKGLLFTNHHCGYDAIASVSTVEHNYLKDGFWAKSHNDEIPVDLSVFIVDDMRDVTAEILKNIPENISPRERQSLIDKNINAYLSRFGHQPYKKFQIKPFFKGNKYYLIAMTEYPDVRLVGTPPESIGKFGGDTDNWMWPRHTGDFSIFRVYAGKDNQPAAYSKDNVPYRPKKFLPVTLSGVRPGEFMLVMGFPGRTNAYLTSYAVKQIQDLRDPARVAVRQKTLDVLKKYMEKDPESELKLSSKFASLANYWKFWIGESKGLKKYKAVEAKQQYEAELQRRINAYPLWRQKYGDLLAKLKKWYEKTEKLTVAADIHREIFYRNIDATVNYALLKSLYRLAKNNPSRFEAVKNRYAGYILNDVMKNFHKEADKEIFAVLMAHYLQVIPAEYIAPDFKKEFEQKGAEKVADEFYSRSVLADKEKLKELFRLDASKFVDGLEKDYGFQLLKKQDDYFNEKVLRPLNEMREELNELMRQYMKIQMLAFKDKMFFPDANFTMRVSYGRVKGFKPRDAVVYKPFTHLYGVMEKYIPGDDEFDVPLRLRQLYEKRDYGRYRNFDGTMVVNFLATNHITGGNSGSPVLNGEGQLVGLAFDGVWEGVMEDIYYRPEVARSIMVDIRYVLFIIDKFAKAKNIIDELTIERHHVKPPLGKNRIKAPVMR